MENYVSTSDARKQLGCSGQTIRNLIKAGKLQALQMENGRFLIDETSLQDYQQNVGKGTVIAKDAKQKTKILHNVKPKAIENPGMRLSKEISERYGPRPEWPHLYQMVLETDINLDDIALECIFRTPEGGFECFCTISAYDLPDDPFKFEDELFFDWYAFDLEYEAAQNYLLTDFRWWVQLTSQKKVIIRSCDDRSPTAGLIEWIDDQEKAIKDEREMLLAQNKRRGEETIGTLALYAGTVALGLLLGLTGKSRPSS